MTKRITVITLAIVAALSGAAVAFRGSLERPVCPDPAERTLAVMTSPSEFAFVKEAAPRVAAEIAARAADECAALATAIGTSRPEGDLELARVALRPARPDAADRRPFVTQMRRDAEAHLERTLLGPLAEAVPSRGGSPVLGTLSELARQRAALGVEAGTIVLLTDGIAVEPGRRGMGGIDFRRKVPPRDEPRRLAAFVPDLAGLEGAHVVILGFGAGTNLGPERVRHAAAALRSVLEQAGAKLTVTRSLDLPKGA